LKTVHKFRLYARITKDDEWLGMEWDDVEAESKSAAQDRVKERVFKKYGADVTVKFI